MNNQYPSWIDAKEKSPRKLGTYLVILNSPHKTNHAKTFAGMGQPETANYTRYADYAGGPARNRWHTRGSLAVAYWMHLPDFNMTWRKNGQGEAPEWV